MVRLHIPPGVSWVLPDGVSGITGPYQFTASGINLREEGEATASFRYTGEYVMTAEGSVFRSLPYLQEEIAIYPLVVCMALIMVFNWIRGAMA